MTHLQKFSDFHKLNEEATVKIVPIGLKGQEYQVNVNGNIYGYGQKEGDELTIKEVAEKFVKLLKFSTGRALTWLKKHTTLVSGSAKNESEDFKLFDIDLIEESAKNK